MSMLKALAAAALLLVLLFTGPVVYRTGQRVALWLNCSSQQFGDGCWEVSSFAVLHGGRMPRQ